MGQVEMKELPEWLQKLWDLDATLAREAEEDYLELKSRVPNPKKPLKAIMVMNNNSYIGLNNDLPWRSSEDLKHFKKLTLGQKLMVGRTTFENLPPLKGREIIVVGTGHNTLEEALAQEPDWVIGGKKLYESTLHLCDELHLSIIKDDSIGDTVAPNLDIFEGLLYMYKFETNG